jgi:hypothetical protein
VTDLHQSILPEQRAGKGGGGPQEARVCHFLYGLTDRQNQGGVDEGNDDVRVKLIWRRRGVSMSRNFTRRGFLDPSLYSINLWLVLI